MKPFTFRLEAVLMLRESEKQKAYEAYGMAIQRRRAIEERIMGISQELKDLRARITDLRKSVFPASLQPSFMGALQDGENRLQHQLAELSKAEQFEQKQLNAFLEAKHRGDILEKLKEKRKETHLRELFREEEKEIEDLVHTRYEPAF